MTAIQKETIKVLRRQRIAYAEISRQLGLPMNTVKSYCFRNGLTVEPNSESVIICKNCGSVITDPSKTRPRLFCSDSCKVEWWNRHRGERKSANILPHICPTCGKEFNAYAGAKRKYCSQTCYRERSVQNED